MNTIIHLFKDNPTVMIVIALVILVVATTAMTIRKRKAQEKKRERESRAGSNPIEYFPPELSNKQAIGRIRRMNVIPHEYDTIAQFGDGLMAREDIIELDANHAHCMMAARCAIKCYKDADNDMMGVRANLESTIRQNKKSNGKPSKIKPQFDQYMAEVFSDEIQAMVEESTPQAIFGGFLR